MEYASGERYEGQFQNNLRHGRGTHWYLDGGEYAGEWRHDQREGLGVMRYADGQVYEGAWKGDVRCGHGSHVGGAQVGTVGLRAVEVLSGT